MGARLTQHPETYHAIVGFVGIYDMPRHETFPNGAYNVTEYGSTTDPAEFAALDAYSPLHRVVPGARYPAVLLETGVNDSRVAPWQSRKFAAALALTFFASELQQTAPAVSGNTPGPVPTGR